MRFPVLAIALLQYCPSVTVCEIIMHELPNVHTQFPMYILNSQCTYSILNVHTQFPMYILNSQCTYSIPNVHTQFESSTFKIKFKYIDDFDENKHGNLLCQPAYNFSKLVLLGSAICSRRYFMASQYNTIQLHMNIINITGDYLSQNKSSSLYEKWNNCSHSYQTQL